MSAPDDVKPRLTPDGKFALVIILSEFITFGGFLFFDQPELGLGTCICIAILMIAMRATWQFHKHGWYWGAVAVSAILQVPFVLYVPWSNHAYRGTMLLPFGALDLMIVWGCIRLVEKVVAKT